MEKKEDSLFKMLLSLGGIAIISSLILAFGYQQTKDIIAAEEENNKNHAIAMVAPQYNNNPIAEKYLFKTNEGTKDSLTIIVYPAKVDGVLVGAAVESVSNKGFSGDITIIYGFNLDGSVRNYKVVKHTETAGLGSKMQEWFSSKKNDQSVINKNPSLAPLAVKKDNGGTIDGITAATISSRAFLGALNDASLAFTSYKNTRAKEALKENE